PLPANPPSAVDVASPNLDQFRGDGGGQFLPPLADATVVRGYNGASGAARNDGIDYAATACAPVRAAGDGEVALVSSALGALSPRFVLIRHDNGLFTVVGRVDQVAVGRGDRVSRGQTIARVAPNQPPTVQFRVMQGTQIIDPEPYL
ncbi:MAG: M23 family metallopeptidase, partial [Pseudomonadota bacterium]